MRASKNVLGSPSENLSFIEKLIKAWDEGHSAPHGAVNPYRPPTPVILEKHEEYTYYPVSLCAICMMRKSTVKYRGIGYCESCCPCCRCHEKSKDNQ